MRTEYTDPIRYYMKSDQGELCVNELIGRDVTLRFDGSIHCILCGRKIRKTFAQGSCYDCFRNAPENAECIIRPELCLAHEGKGRDPEWERAHHDRPHFVYLALSSAVKVGVTREDQIPVRWIDQGASEGLVLARCPNRYTAGLMEVFLKTGMTDRTNWQRMLKNQRSPDSLAAVKEKLRKDLPAEFRSLVTGDSDPTVLSYPVLEFPEKVKSLKLDRVPEYTGRLNGIKGQYWLFAGGTVWNVRAHGGYDVLLTDDAVGV